LYIILSLFNLKKDVIALIENIQLYVTQLEDEETILDLVETLYNLARAGALGADECKKAHCADHIFLLLSRRAEYSHEFTREVIHLVYYILKDASLIESFVKGKVMDEAVNILKWEVCYIILWYFMYFKIYFYSFYLNFFYRSILTFLMIFLH
jgi:hypothetical protein